MSAGARDLTLLIPGLTGPTPPGRAAPHAIAALLAQDLSPPATRRLLTRAVPSSQPLASTLADELAFEVFAVPRPDGGDWPAGAVTREASTGDAGDAVWIRADPVHLRADLGGLLLFEAAALDLDLAEAAAVCEWLNAQAGDVDLVLEPASASCWLARVDRVPAMATRPPLAAHGRDVGAYLPRGPDAARWHARMNEIQMLLHACPINEARERRGAPAINSLWFWGAGPLPPAPRPAGFAAVYADGDVLRGLARLSGIDARPPPHDAAGWLTQAPPGDSLVLIDALEAAVRGDDVAAWRACVDELERAWLAPLERATARGRLRRLRIEGGGGAGVEIGRRALGRWWRRPRPFAELIGALRARCDA